MDWPLHLWQVLLDELVAFEKTPPEQPDPFPYLGEDIDELSLLATQIAARKPDLTKLITDAPFAAKIDQLKLAPNAGTEQIALEVLNQLLKTPNLGNAFLNVPIARSVLEQERKSE